jgi:hypothetical protein
MADIDLEKLIDQRAEARGDLGYTVSFEWGGKTFTFRDPLMLDDDEKDDLAEIEHDVDVAAWYMGDDQYDDFVETVAHIPRDDGTFLDIHGSSSVFFEAFRAHMREAQAENEGNPTRRNRSSRRAASRRARRR